MKPFVTRKMGHLCYATSRYWCMWLQREDNLPPGCLAKWLPMMLNSKPKKI